MCCNCIYADLGWFSLLLLLFSSGISHRLVTASRSPSIMTLLFLITCTLCSPKSTWQPASHSTGTETSDLSISLKACPCCAMAGRCGERFNCLVVVEFIVVLFAHRTPNCSWWIVVPSVLCFLARNVPVAAVSGWPCGMLLVIGCSFAVRLISLLLLLLVTAAAYDMCFVREDGLYCVNSFLINLF